jgi:hypothetical protein
MSLPAPAIARSGNTLRNIQQKDIRSPHIKILGKTIIKQRSAPAPAPAPAPIKK